MVFVGRWFVGGSGDGSSDGGDRGSCQLAQTIQTYKKLLRITPTNYKIIPSKIL